MQTATQQIASSELLKGTLPRSPDDPSIVRAAITPERWHDFHEGRRILIVDDNERSAARIGELLRPLYGTVDVECSSKKALQLIEAAAKRGEPFDAVVLDLFMPELNGIDLLRSLKEKVPAVVINTASMLDPVVSDMAVRMDDYRSSERLALYAQYKRSGEGAAVPPEVPILFNHKFGSSLSELVQKIDSAQLIASGGAARTQKFLREFSPELVVRNVSDEIVHGFCEEVGNVVKSVEGVLRHLRTEGRIEESAWWGKNGASVVRALDTLRGVTFNGVTKENAKLTGGALHSAVTALQGLEGPDTAEPKEFAPRGEDKPSDFAVARVAEWNRHFETAKRLANGLFRKFKEHNSETVSIPNLMKQATDGLFTNVELILDGVPGPVPELTDPDRTVRVLLRDLMVALKERCERVGKRNPDIAAALGCTTDENGEILHESQDAKLKGLKCEHFIEIAYFDGKGGSLEKDLERLAPQFAELIARKQGFFTIYEENQQLSLVLKLTDLKPKAEVAASVDALPESENTLALTRAEPDEVKKIGRYNARIFKGLGADGKVTAIETGASYLVSGENAQKPILFFDSNLGALVAVDAGMSHLSGASVVASYLLENSPVKRISYGENPRALSELVYRYGVRLEIKDGNVFVDLDKRSEDARPVKEVMQALGFPASRIIFDKKKFEQF